MLILPLRHTELVARRWPVVTTAIVALNVLVFFASLLATRAQQQEYVRRRAEASEYLQQHPYLQVPLSEETLRGRGPAGALTGPGGEEQAEQQRHLEQLVVRAMDVQDRSVVGRYGYRPARWSVATLFTSQFLHGGILHLLMNMWFLWLVGCNVEDRWGRLFFSAFYLTAGAAAALAHHLSAAASTTPLIGASGAVAGAMGAFLVRHASARIDFWGWMYIRTFRFSAPAWLMLPLWALGETLQGLLMRGSGPGVAHWAHVGGFVFGAAVALLVWASGLEKRVDAVLAPERTQDPALAEASRAIDAGRAAEAVAVLEHLGTKAPASIEVQLELLRASKRAGERGAELRAYHRLIALYLKEAEGTAVELYDEMRGRGMVDELAPGLRIRVIKAMDRLGRAEDAMAHYSAMHRDAPADEHGVMALLAHADQLLKRGQFDEAVRLLTIAKGSPVAHVHFEAAIDRLMGSARRQSVRPPSSVPAVPPRRSM